MQKLSKLRWYEWLWCALPLALALTGSVFALICAALAFTYNVRTFASAQDSRLKYMITALATVTATIIYLLGGLILAAVLTPAA